MCFNIIYMKFIWHFTHMSTCWYVNIYIDWCFGIPEITLKTITNFNKHVKNKIRLKNIIIRLTWNTVWQSNPIPPESLGHFLIRHCGVSQQWRINESTYLILIPIIKRALASLINPSILCKAQALEARTILPLSRTQTHLDKSFLRVWSAQRPWKEAGCAASNLFFSIGLITYSASALSDLSLSVGFVSRLAS